MPRAIIRKFLAAKFLAAERLAKEWCEEADVEDADGYEYYTEQNAETLSKTMPGHHRNNDK